MKRILFGSLLLACAGALHSQTITSVQNESGSSALCPGGVAFVRGTGLGNNKTTVTVGSKQAFVLNGGATSLQIEMPVDAPLGATTLTAGTSAAFSLTLVQYCPGIPTDGLPDSLAGAFHYPSGTPVTAAYPASPNEQIGLGATGLGPTNPVYATGTSPTNQSAVAVAVTLPTVTVGGKTASVSTAFLQPNSPGFYAVIITVPANAANGNQNVTLSIGGLTSNTAVLPVATGPIITSVTNAASYTDPSVPNSAIAQGSIAIIKGNNMGPATISIDSKPFQNTTLSSTSISVTVAGTTVAGLMYYTSSSQVAFLLPSNTPVGPGTITGTYNGQAGPASPIRVVSSTLGIFTVTSDGQGAGIVTYPDYSLVSSIKAANCGGVYTTCGAANPGDVLTIWATGLGPVSGSDASGAGLGVNMTSLPLTVWLGGVQLQAAYQGRSGCCIGEDQVVFTVPANTPTGCAVPLSVQIGNFISNTVAIAVAAAGTRTCTPADSTFTAANVAQASSSSGPFTYGEIDLRHRDDNPGFDDEVMGQVIRFTIPAAVQPFWFTYIDQPPLGTCQVTNLNGINPPINVQAGLDIGAQLTVQGPNGSKTVMVSGAGFKESLSNTGNFLSPGAYTISTPGGADLPALQASITIPTLSTLTSPPPDAANPIVVTRSNGLNVAWSGGPANGIVDIEVFNCTDPNCTNGADVNCWAPASAGSFNIPASVLIALPGGNLGQLAFRPYAISTNIPGSGLNVSVVKAWNVYSTPLMIK